MEGRSLERERERTRWGQLRRGMVGGGGRGEDPRKGQNGGGKTIIQKVHVHIHNQMGGGGRKKSGELSPDVERRPEFEKTGSTEIDD